MKKIFRIYVIAMCFFVCCSVLSVSATNDNSGIQVKINGEYVNFTNDTGFPFVDENNRTMVPLRVTMESAGATVGYDAEKNTAIVSTLRDRVEVPIGTDYLYNNNKKIQNDTFSVELNGRTYLPIRAVFESLDFVVEWEDESQTVNAYNFPYENTPYSVYSTSSLETLVREVLNGNVVYIDGQWYATPEYVKQNSSIAVNDVSNDINTAIYPQPTRFELAELNDSMFEWISGITNFEKGMVRKDSLDNNIKHTEEAEIPGYVYVYGFYESGLTTTKLVYPVDDITDDFLNAENALGSFNGIRMKKENGVLFFNYSDLVELGLYK